MTPDWTREFPAAITVADLDGTIVAMNQAAGGAFQKSGGTDLIGQSLFACHPEPANEKIRELLQTRKTNAYTIEKNGVKKLIYQAPWFENGEFAGLVELSLVIPAEMPHFVRKAL
jgi:transcriptional regulator with PAS, ATPase and Fis domain